MSAAGRLEGYIWTQNPKSGGTSYTGAGKPCILLHMTVSTGLSQSYVATHPYPPHCWANPKTGDKWQTIELDNGGLALYQPDYGSAYVNRKPFTLQTELVGYPVVNQTTYTDADLRWIAANVVVPQERWLRARGLTANIGNYRYHPNSSGSASVDWSGRMTEAEWASFNGLCAHIDAWGNDHWDCSVERLDLISKYSLEILGGSPPAGGGFLMALSDAEQADLYAKTKRNNELLERLNMNMFSEPEGNLLPLPKLLNTTVPKVDRVAEIIERDNANCWVAIEDGNYPLANLLRSTMPKGRAEPMEDPAPA